MKKLLSRLWKDESGASLIEYVLIAGLISIAGYGAMTVIGGDVGNILGSVQTASDTAKTSAATNA
jgi:pilus assembly protein Flp/PilA